MEIITNKIKCNYCGDIIESKTVHDYKQCKCGKVSVDGGHYYLSRNFPGEVPFNPDKHFTDLSHYITDEGEEINDEAKN